MPSLAGLLVQVGHKVLEGELLARFIRPDETVALNASVKQKESALQDAQHKVAGLQEHFRKLIPNGDDSVVFAESSERNEEQQLPFCGDEIGVGRFSPSRWNQSKMVSPRKGLGDRTPLEVHLEHQRRALAT